MPSIGLSGYFNLDLRALGRFKGISVYTILKRIIGELALAQKVRECHVNVAERHMCLVCISGGMLLSVTVATAFPITYQNGLLPVTGIIAKAHINHPHYIHYR